MNNPITKILDRVLARPSTEGSAEGLAPPVSETQLSGTMSALDLASALDDPVILIDGHANVAFANASATEAFGAFNLGGSLFLRFRAPEIRELVETARLSGKPSTAEYSERVPLERVYRVVISGLGDAAGLWVLVFKDQSETRRIDRMRADFIANASHELRTPLASVSGFIETLRGPARNDPKAREQFLDIMQAQTARMARLIDDLLSLSRLEMKSRVDSRQSVDLSILLDRVVAAMAPLAAESAVTIQRSQAKADFIVAGDSDELTQVFENLIENACKYGRAGGRILVELSRSGSEVRVAVTDFGEGIAEQHIPRVTERFYRVDADLSSTQKGTGLGLAIVKHILTRHGGRLSIRSKLGEGSTFTVHLPARRGTL